MIAPKNLRDKGDSVKKPVFITRNEEMKSLYEKIRLVARSHAPAFITGESGTGKEVLARLLHYHSPRRDHPFIAINCGALPKDLVESELFGHEKGAFTGALNTKIGCFEQADRGIIFLDEIGEMPPDIQVKLLRAVELKCFRRLGGNREIKTDVQIISATNRNVTDLIERGKFREDLYYRLNVIELHIPPLRERSHDIPLLSEFFLSKYILKHNLEIKKLSDQCMEYIKQYHWPGNVRELCNVIERCAIMCPEETVRPEHLPKALVKEKNSEGSNSSAAPEEDGKSAARIPIGTSMEEAERTLIRLTLTYVNNNKSKAARMLGVSRKTLHNKLNRLGFTESSI